MGNLHSSALGWLGTHVSRWSLVSLKQEVHQKLYNLKTGTLVLEKVPRKSGHDNKSESNCQGLSYVCNFKTFYCRAWQDISAHLCNLECFVQPWFCRLSRDRVGDWRRLIFIVAQDLSKWWKLISVHFLWRYPLFLRYPEFIPTVHLRWNWRICACNTLRMGMTVLKGKCFLFWFFSSSRNKKEYVKIPAAP